MKTRNDRFRLRRNKPELDPKRRFTIYCEGKNTEPGYFEAIRRIYRNSLLVIHPDVGVPKTIAERAVRDLKQGRPARERRRRKSQFAARDVVWVVFDRDEHPGFEDAIRRCQQNCIRVGASNPCFELWLVLHDQDYNAPVRSDQIQSILSQLRPEYRRRRSKVLDFDALVLRVIDAEGRAERQLELRKSVGDPFGNPSTRVGKLTSSIRLAHSGDTR